MMHWNRLTDHEIRTTIVLLEEAMARRGKEPREVIAICNKLRDQLRERENLDRAGVRFR